MSSIVILVTGAAGYLGTLLARALLEQQSTETPKLYLILSDITKPEPPKFDAKHAGVLCLKADLTKSEEVNALFGTKFGIPDTVYCMHGIMSRGSEDNFDLGFKVNFDAVRMVLDAARRFGQASSQIIKFIHTSAFAVYGGPLPDVLTPDTIATPESSYGTAKLCAELLINEYSRRGFVDGRILRLPGIVVRGGPPAAATTSFFSGIIREPLKGLEAVCPIGTSLDSPSLSLKIWIASPHATIRNLIHARTIPSSSFRSHTRVVCLPGMTVTIKDELDALAAVGGKELLQLIKFEPDKVNERVVMSFPTSFDNSYALSLSFVVDQGGMVPIVRKFKEELDMGLV